MRRGPKDTHGVGAPRKCSWYGLKEMNASGIQARKEAKPSVDKAILVADATFAIIAVSSAILSRFELSGDALRGKDIRDVLTHYGAAENADDLRWNDKPVSWCAQIAGDASVKLEVTSWTLGVEPPLRIVSLGALDRAEEQVVGAPFDVSMARDLVHDLNNVFTTIGGHVTLLQSQNAQDGAIARRVEKLMTAGQWGRELLAKLSAGLKAL
jgi:hypothetical protein